MRFVSLGRGIFVAKAAAKLASLRLVWSRSEVMEHGIPDAYDQFPSDIIHICACFSGKLPLVLKTLQF